MNKECNWEDLVPFISDGKFGFKNIQDGRIVIEPQYEFVKDFEYGMAVVGCPPNIGVINSTGEVVIPFEYDRVYIQSKDAIFLCPNDNNEDNLLWINGTYYNYKYSYADSYGRYVSINGKAGVINHEDGILIPCEYDYILPPVNGMFRLVNNGKIGYADEKGNVVVQCLYDEYELSPEEDEHIYENCIVVASDGLYGLLKLDGTVLLPFEYDEFIYCQEGAVYLKKGNKAFIYDTGSKVLSEYVYDVSPESDRNQFWDGIAEVEKDGKIGYIDRGGELIVPCLYDNNHLPVYVVRHQDLIAVSINGNWGLLNRDGQEVLPLIYDECPSYIGNDTKLVQNGKIGVSDRNGKLILPCIYDSVRDNDHGYLVSRNGKEEILSKEGKTLYTYDKIFGGEIYNKGKYISVVESEGKQGLIDSRTGKIIIPCQYDRIKDLPFCIQLSEGSTERICDFDGRNIREKTFDMYDYIFKKNHTLTIIKSNGKFGLVDESGHEIIPCCYDALTQVSCYPRVRFFDLLTAYTSDDNAFTLYDFTGKALNDHKYKNIAYFKSGIGFIGDEEGYSLVDPTGKILHEHICDDIVGIDEEPYRWKFIKDGKQGIIEEDGRISVPFEYDSIIKDYDRDFGDHYDVEKDGLHGLLDFDGRCLVPPLYEYYVGQCSRSIWHVIKDGIEGFIDRWSNFVPCPQSYNGRW